MKKLCSFFLLFFFVCSSAFCDVSIWNKDETPIGEREGVRRASVLRKLASMENLTFFKSYEDLPVGLASANDLRADFSLGSPVATFTAARSATAPATYVDEKGVVRLVTQANVGRIQGGYYDATGFHTVDSNGRSVRGLIIEESGTNRATYSESPENAAWTKTNITADDDDSGSNSPDGKTTSNSLTATNANGTFEQAYVDGTAGVYTASVWIKRKTGTGKIYIQANAVNGYVEVTANVGTTWTRVNTKSTSLTNPTFGIKIETNGDAVYVYGMQLEKKVFMTSYVPSLTTAKVRSSEVLTYTTSKNLTPSGESLFFKFVPNWDNFVAYNRGFYSTANSGSRRVLGTNFGNTLAYYPNYTDSGSCVVSDGAIGTTINTSAIINAISKQSSPYASLYVNGVSTGTKETTDNFTSNSFPATFNVGRNENSNAVTHGNVCSIAIFSDAKDLSKILKINEILNS